MSIDIEQKVAAMQRMPIAELRAQYERVFGETTTTRHAPCLLRRIAWRLQANVQGGLSEHARQRAHELANEAELRLTAPRPRSPAADGETVTIPAPAAIRDAETDPTVGTQLERLYKGQKIVVTIAENGVRWNGELYRSLTAVARAVTGDHWNGKAFFGLTRRAGQ
jgi:hypothetical protein